MVSDKPPTHSWNGDALGHNCADCPKDSNWRCDPHRHGLTLDLATGTWDVPDDRPMDSVWSCDPRCHTEPEES